MGSSLIDDDARSGTQGRSRKDAVGALAKNARIAGLLQPKKVGAQRLYGDASHREPSEQPFGDEHRMARRQVDHSARILASETLVRPCNCNGTRVEGDPPMRRGRRLG